jgi:hypothetical protein
MMSRGAWRCAVVVVVNLVLAGCGASGPAKGHVKGKVTLDDRPIEKGTILFTSPDQKLPNTGVDIRQGAYEADVYAGPMIVQISALKAVGKRKSYDAPDSPLEDIYQEQLPPRFNVESELTADIKPGEQELNFALSSR